ncbi:TPA: hypothetical protein ACJCPP_000301 [Neisseria meningitidis]
MRYFQSIRERNVSTHRTTHKAPPHEKFQTAFKGSSETTIFAFAHSGTSSNRFGTFLSPLTAYNESTYSSSKGIIYANPHPLRSTAGFFNRCLCRGRIHAAIRQPVRRRRLHAKPDFERALRLWLFGRQCFARAVMEKSARRDKKFRPDRLR